MSEFGMQMEPGHLLESVPTLLPKFSSETDTENRFGCRFSAARYPGFGLNPDYLGLTYQQRSLSVQVYLLQCFLFQQCPFIALCHCRTSTISFAMSTLRLVPKLRFTD